MDASTAGLDVGTGGGAHPGLLQVDAQAEKNERHGKSRVKIGAATCEESRRRMSPSSAFSRRGRSGGEGLRRAGGDPVQHQTNAKHSAKIRRF